MNADSLYQRRPRLAINLIYYYLFFFHFSNVFYLLFSLFKELQELQVAQGYYHMEPSPNIHIHISTMGDFSVQFCITLEDKDIQPLLEDIGKNI